MCYIRSFTVVVIMCLFSTYVPFFVYAHTFIHQVPSSPELNYIRVENSTNNNSNTVVFEFLLIPKNGTMYWISVEPASPECVESCLYSTENTTISIPLQGNVLYNITSKASRCNREVNSTESKLTDFVLQGNVIFYFSITYKLLLSPDCYNLVLDKGFCQQLFFFIFKCLIKWSAMSLMKMMKTFCKQTYSGTM